MPVFSNKVSSLLQIGPIVEIIILPPPPITARLKAANKPIPSKQVIALIDTGASRSAINNSIAKELNLIVRDIVEVHTPTGSSQQYVYDLTFMLPNLTHNLLPMQALGINMENQPYAALIGRDVLSFCTLIYNGWDNSYQLHI